jgi:spore coat polysaccharide biosynthesis protein SpsF
MKVVAFVQARLGSSRLPGKVLKELGGQPLLAWCVERARRAQTVTQVAVATTDNPADDPIVAACMQRGYDFYRGSQFDVLDRYYQAARYFDAEVVVRITADCPFIDPVLIDLTVQEFLDSGADFAANRLPPPWKRTYPIGLDTEVCAMAGLERAWKEATQKFEREHVMPYFYDREGRFKVHVLHTDPDFGYLRWTVDTPADLELLRAVVQRLDGRMDFTWQEVLAIFQREPELASINAGVQHKTATDVDQRME